jgi:hypothetical protein
MKKALLPIVALGLVGGALLGGVQHIVRERRASFTPPGNARTLRALVAAGEKLDYVRRIQRDGATYYVVGGEYVSWTLASGPRCYVFDRAGALVAFSPTTGDGELREYFYQPGTVISLDETLRETQVTLPR